MFTIVIVRRYPLHYVNDNNPLNVAHCSNEKVYTLDKRRFQTNKEVHSLRMTPWDVRSVNWSMNSRFVFTFCWGRESSSEWVLVVHSDYNILFLQVPCRSVFTPPSVREISRSFSEYVLFHVPRSLLLPSHPNENLKRFERVFSSVCLILLICFFGCLFW